MPSTTADCGEEMTSLEDMSVPMKTEPNSSSSDDDDDKKEPPLLQRFVEEISHLRWRMLLLDCLMTFGQYYMFDFPGAFGAGPTDTIQARFESEGKEYTQEMNNALYSAYAYPNVVLAFFGGILIDKYLGLRRGVLVFTCIVIVGAAMFYLGVLTTNYPLIVTSRFVFGVGAESLSVAQSTVAARWFDARRIALAFSITIAVSRGGASLNYLVSPPLAKHGGVEAAALLGAALCLVSGGFAIILVTMDKRATERGIVPPESKDSAQPMKWTDLKKLRAEMVLLCIICMVIYVPVIPFISIAENYLERKYSLSPTAAGRYLSLYQGVGAVGSPLAGALVDFTGFNAQWIILVSAVLGVLHFLFIVTSLPPAFMIVLFACTYSSLIACVWPSVPLAIAPQLTGVGYGVMTSMLNLGMAIFPEITGIILDKHTPEKKTPSGKHELPTLEGYNIVLGLFMIMSILSLTLGIVLAIVDRRRTKVLTSSAKARVNPFREVGVDDGQRAIEDAS